MEVCSFISPEVANREQPESRTCRGPRSSETNVASQNLRTNLLMPLSETDPAYPADLIHDQVEGVVVLYAVTEVMMQKD